MKRGEDFRSRGRLRLALEVAAFAVLVASAVRIYQAATGPQPEIGPSLTVAAGAPQPLPDPRFQDAQGRTLGLSDFRGKFLLLNVWATWCPPCRKEMPSLDRLQQQLSGPGFEVVALSIDNGGPAAVQAFYKEMGIRALAVYVDSASEATSKLRTLGIPTTILVDREGRELWRKTGPAEWDSPQFIDSLRRRHVGTVAS